MELRDYEAVETRAEQRDNSTVIQGHAAVFNSKSLLLPPERGMARPFFETISPGAFADTLKDRNVFALVAHDKGKVLGSTRSGTLTLNEDDRGLKYEVTLPNTTYANDLAELCRRGDLTTCSFGFQVQEQDITANDDGIPVRRLDKVSLAEISLGVASPAYTATTMSVRSVEDFIHEQERAKKLGRLKLRLKILGI